MDLSKIGIGNNIPEEVNAVIDIAADSDPVKYEIDEDSGNIAVNRFLQVSMRYPCNYGFIPHTKGGDGDYTDILVVTRYPIMPSSIITVRPIGVLIMEDEGGEDVKILSVPVSRIDSYYDNIINYDDFPRIKISQIEHFFTKYKDLDHDKFVNIKEWRDNTFAKKIILEAAR